MPERVGELLAELVRLPGVSSREEPVARAIRRQLDEVGEEWEEAVHLIGRGNLALGIGGVPCRGLGDYGGRTLMVAHLDEVGLLVSSLREDGYLAAIPVGRFWLETWLGRPVQIHTAQGSLPGVVACPSLHLSGRSLPPVGDSLLIDIGAQDQEEIRQLGIRPGDPVCWIKQLSRIGNHRVAARSIDDRMGCAALVALVEQLSRSGAQPVADIQRADLVVAFSVQEELGLRGARQLAHALGPFDLVVPVDIFPSSDSPFRESQALGGARLGEGCLVRGIDSTTVVERGLLDAVMTLATRTSTPLQEQALATRGGNDGSVWESTGAQVLPLSIPVRYTHATEVIDLRDLSALVRLLLAIVTG